MRSELEIRRRRHQLREILAMPGMVPGEAVMRMHEQILSWVLGESDVSEKAFNDAVAGLNDWLNRN